MKRNRWQVTFILGLTVCSTTLLTSCFPRLDQFDISLQDLQIWLMVWLKNHNPFDTSITTKFVGIGLSDTETFFLPNPKTLVASAFPEESTECTGNPKNLATLPLRSIQPQFRKCVAEIAQQTQVPILLPAKLPSSWINELPIYTYFQENAPYESPDYKSSQGYSIGITLFRGDHYQSNNRLYRREKSYPSHSDTKSSKSRPECKI
ncbi:MAG: hypothetical protein DCF22_13060 [Leptolyngbya sp.]|nr:MAG: hypothetical protein DCF22_13060 [Leptolyngbya sp.]